MTSFSRYRFAFGALLVAAFVSAAGMLLRAEPPQAVGTWASLGATPDSRVGAAAVALPDGRTLIAGGSIAGMPTDTVVIFNPADGSFASAGQLLASRVGHTATLLDDGRVLIAGGTVASLLTADLELFDPSSGTSSLGGTMPQPRSGHAAARLADGKVLIAGGTSTDGVVLQTAEIYDPSAGTTTPTTLPMLLPRTGASATTLIDGRVLIAGGSSNGSADLASAELYHPWSQMFEAVDTAMSVARSGHAAVLLPWNNSVLIAGGTSNGVAQLTSDLFLPAEFPDPYSYGMGHFGPTGSMAAPRVHAVAAPHIEGYAVAMGGGAADAEVYRFATIKTDKDDYAPGVKAIITGSGWQPDEDVTLVFQEDPAVHDDYVLHFMADSEGNIFWDQWAPEEHDLNVRFYLTAKQATPQGERRAQMTFTDSKPNKVTVGTQSPNPVVAGLSATYPITVIFSGNGPCTSPLSVSPPLPADVTALFNPSSATTTNGENVTSTLTLTTTLGTTPIGSTSFTVLAADGGGTCQSGTASGTGTLAVVAPTTTATTTTVASSQNPSTFGQPVSFTATVAPSSGSTAPTGSVQFLLDGVNFGSPVTLTASGSNGVATSGSTATLNVAGSPHSVTANYTPSGSFGSSSGSGGQVVNKANATVVVTAYAVTYDGSPHTATVTSITGVNGQTGATVGTVTLSTTHTAAGTYSSDAWSFTGTANYNNIAATTITDTINKATASVVVTPYTVTYDGLSHSAAITSITGVNGQTGATVGTVDVSNTAHTNAGTFASDSWSFTGTANYNNIAATTISDTINKATAVVVVTPYTVTYDGLSHSAAITSVTGVNGQTGATVGTVDVSNTAHTNAGTFASDSWSFTGTANYTNIAATTISDTINKATATVVVTPYTVTYDGLPHSAAITSITGVNGQTGATVGTVDVSNTAHTNAGTFASDSWSFTGTANYTNIAATTISDTINKATAVVVVTPYTVTYDGLSHSAAITSVTGVNGETDATVGTVDVSNTAHTNAGTFASDSWSFTGTANYTNIAATTISDTINKATATVVVAPYTVTYDGLSHSAAITSVTGVNGETDATVGTVDVSNTAHTNAGTFASDSWSFTGTANYTNIAATTISDTINKATAVVVVTPYTVTYDGLSHSAAITSVTGVNGETDATVGTVDVSNTAHTNAGTFASDSWSFTGTANYTNIAATPITDTINKADATVSVSGYTGVYDGNAHSATGTATGVKAESLSGLDLGASFTNVAGGTATWTFTDTTGNYNNATGTAAIVISKADATVSVSGYTGVYDGNAHSATGTATGVKAESLSGLDLGASFTNVAGGTATWTFTDTTGNYNNATGTAAIVISKADATVSVSGYTGVYDGNAHSATGTATGVKAESLSGLDLGASFTNVAGGTATWTFTDTTGNYNNATGTAAIVISKADATVSVSGYTGVYDGNAHSATGTATGVKAESLSGLDLGASFTNVAGGTATWTFTDTTGNYNNATGTAAIVISKADATVSVSGYTGVYDGNAHSATGTATGVKAESLSGLDLGASFTNVAGGTATWTFTDTTGNYNNATGTAAIVISKADATVSVSGYTGVYDGNAHSATGTATGVKAESLSGLDLGASFTNVAGGTATWTFTDTTGNYNNATGTAAIVISKADATVSVSGYTGVYDGNAHSATGTATGVKAESLSGLDLGASFTNVAGGTATWTFTDTTGNYNNATGTAAIVISKADATVSVSGYTGVYDGNAHSATGTATGVKAESLSGLDLGASFTNVAGGTATWTFTDTTGNYNNATGTAAIVISKADATVSVSGYTGVYDGNAHSATGTATGVKAESLSGLDLGASFTNVAGGTATWTFTDTTGNYNNATGTAAIVISKADATVSVSGYTGVYDGNAHSATGTATGVKAESLSGLDLGASFTNVAGGTATWTFTDTTGNYNNATGTAAIVISKADATVSVSGYTGVYDGNAHSATGTATGVKAESLSGLDLGASFTNVAGGTATWTFTDTTGNYNNATGTAAIVISKADATVSVSGYTGVYDGNAHSATGTATGVKAESLSGLDLGASFTNVAGGTATWTFTDTTGNYNNATGTAAIVISKADATVSVSGYTGVYDGNAHSATGTATGVKAESLSGLDLGASFTNVAGGTATWTFTDTTGNYNNATGTAAIVISKADATVSVSGYTGVYDGNAHSATGTATGVKAESLSGLDLGASFTNVAGGTATWTFTDTTGNYNNATGTAAIVISKADATVSVSGYTGVYDGNAHSATGTATGVKAESLSGLDLGASFTNVAGGTATWTFTDTTGNYNNATGTAAIVISKADATVSVSGYTGVYDGNAHSATGTATGVKAESLSGLDLGASFTNVAGGTATWTFTDTTGNYNNATGTAAIVISKADATVSVSGYTGVYDGNAHSATGTATGVKAESLSGLDLGASFTNVAGGTATWTFTDTTGNYNNATGTAAIVISKADATVSVSGYTGVYDGNAHSATGTATGVKAESLSGLDLGASFTNVAGGTATWTFTDTTGNYNNATGTAAIVISKADATVSVSGYTGVYDGNAHSATGTATGVKAESLSGLDLGASFTNVAGGTATWTFTDTTGNYNNATGTAAIVISKADATVSVSGYTGVYDGNAHSATGTATGVKAESLSGLDLGASFTNVAGGTATWTFTDTTGNYNNATGTAAIVISKADATVSVSGYTGVYDGNAHSATGTATGVKAESLSGLDLGASFTNVAGGTATWTFTDTTGNYNNATGTAAIVISKADATVSVSGYTGVYDGNAHSATGTATGVKAESLSGLDLGASFTNVAGGTATWTFTDTTGNYNNATGTAAIVISKADATVSVSGYTGVYDGNAHSATGTATGVKAESLSGLDLGASFTNVAGGTATWTFTDTTGNYNNATGTAAIVISKADATVSVSGYTGVYDGNAHSATGTATGVKAESLSGLDLGASFTNVAGGTATWTFTDTTGNYNNATGTAAIVISKADATVSVSGYTGVYDGNAHSATGTATGVKAESLSGLDLGASFTNVAGGTATWTFTDTTGNYNNATGTAAIVISKADATVSVSGYTGVYDGNAHSATGTATGVKAESLSGLDLGASFTNVAGGTATWTFTDTTGNYNNATGTAAIVISKADATVSVSGYTGVYDGNAHSATGTATGVKAESLSGLDLGASFTNVAGGTATWTFTDTTGNYNNATGTAAIVISKADATVSVSGYTGVYDGNAHSATGTATGVKAESLSGLDLGASFTNVAGGTATWTFTDTTGNYNNATGTAAIVISKADATVSVSGYTGVYDGNAHSATGTATGVKAESLSGLDLGASFTNVAGGTATWTFTDTTGNYNNATGTAAIVISKADATVSVSGYTGVYDGNAHSATGTATGVKAESLSGLDLGASFTNVAGGTATWTFTDTTGNYNNATGTAAIVISKADATVSVSGYTGVYDGNAHSATGTATGVKAESLSGLDLGASFTNVAGGTATWTFTDTTGNYNNATGTAAIVISKADATVSVSGYTGTYNAAAHGATGTFVGVVSDPSAAGSSLNLGASFNSVPGGTANWTFSGGTNYNDQSGTAAVVINKANAVINVTPYSVTYNGAAHTATGTATGVLSESLSGLNLSGTTHTAAGAYASDAWTFTDVTGNYNNAGSTVSDSIAKKAASVTANAKSKVYGATDPALTGALVGFLSGDNVTATYSRTAGETVAGGPYTISAALSPAGVLGNYAITSNTAGLTITKATLTVTADNKNKLLNAVNPTLTASYSGFVNGDTFASGVTGTPSLTTTGLVNSPVGAYPITGALGTLIAPNYTLSFANGTLTVLYKWDGFLQPINDTAHDLVTMSKFKAGQTIPAKFDIKDVNGVIVQQTGSPLFSYIQTAASCSVPDADNLDAVYQASPQAIYTLSGGHYQYNWSTKGLSGLYRIFAKLSDGTTQSVDICLSK